MLSTDTPSPCAQQTDLRHRNVGNGYDESVILVAIIHFGLVASEAYADEGERRNGTTFAD